MRLDETVSPLALDVAVRQSDSGGTGNDPARRSGHLSERIIRAFAGAFGSEEHAQIAALIRDADKHVVDLDAAKAVLRTLDEATWSIEANLYRIPVPHGPVWYEWPLPTRTGWGGGDDALTGCLAVPHPIDPRLLTVVTAWHGAGEPTHSYGIGLVHFDDLEELARSANLQSGRERSDCLTRILSNVRASIPEGFRAEIEILADGIDDVHEASMRSATAEIPFLLALMLAASVPGGVTGVGQDGEHVKLGFPSSKPRSRFSTILDRLLGRSGRTPSEPPVIWSR